jgi:hypothetical protein
MRCFFLEEMDALLCKATADANQFNSDSKYAQVGVMRAFTSMDGVSKLLHLYSDDMVALQATLGIDGKRGAATNAAV